MFTSFGTLTIYDLSVKIFTDIIQGGHLRWGVKAVIVRYFTEFGSFQGALRKVLED